MRNCINCAYSYRAYVNGHMRCKTHKGHKLHPRSQGECPDWKWELDKEAKNELSK